MTASAVGEARDYARCEDMRSLSEGRLLHRLGTADAVVMASVGHVVRIFLEL